MGCPCFPNPEREDYWCPHNTPDDVQILKPKPKTRRKRAFAERLDETIKVLALDMRAQGHSYGKISKALDVSERQIRRWWHAKQSEGVI